MARDFTKQDMINLSNEIAPVLTKLNKCYNYKNRFQKELSEILCSDDIIRQCVHILNQDFKSGISPMQIGDVISNCFELFKVLYRRQIYISSEIEVLYQKYASDLQTAIEATDLASDGFFWTFVPAIVKTKVVDGYHNMMMFKESGNASKIDAIYQILYSPMTTDIDKIIMSWQEHHDEWNRFVLEILKATDVKSSVYVSNSKKLITRFKKISSESFTDDVFDVEKEKYKDYVQRLIVRETTKDVVLDIYTELEKIPVEDLNKDSSRIRISALTQNGFKTVADIYRAPIQTIESIKGISKDTAHKIKYKVNEMVNLLESKNQTVKEPLKLNYDSHTKDATEIIKAIYNYKRFFLVKKRFSQMKQFDNYELNVAIKNLQLFKYDINWLFFDDATKRAIIKSYKYLKSLLDDERYKVYGWFFRYKFETIENVKAQNAWDDFKDNNVAYLNCIESLVPDAFEDAAFAYGLSEDLAEQIDKEIIYPKGLTCELRRYQVWGVKYILHQMRALLGDEMGLGKTIQSIAVMVSLKNVGFNHFIVICPASVVINWFKEIRQHSKLQAYVGHGSPKERKDAVNAWKYYGGVLITTYETYSNLDISDDDLKSVGIVVVDEAHYIKNPDATRSKNIRVLCSKVERVLFLTGTAIENKVDEMLSLLGVLNQNVADNARIYATLTTSQQFKDAVAPVYFRRRQCDVNKELPEKIETIDWCQMNQVEYDAYDEVILRYDNPFMPMRRVSWNVADIRYSSKAQALKRIVEEAVTDKRKVIVFSFFRDTLDKVCQLFVGHCSEIIYGSISPAKRQEIIDEFSKNESQYVLVSQIQAGGTGLNIQSASVVVMCEPQIKPSIENQAIARAHRMGQSRNVIVHRLCCVNSIDERMLKILDAKKEQFEVFADRSVAGDKSLDLNENDAAIKSAIAEEIQAAKIRHGVVDGKSLFRQSADGESWHKMQQAEADIMGKKIQNRGRQRTVTASQRYRILTRDTYRCQKCGRYGTGVINISQKMVDGSICTPSGDILPKGYTYATGLQVDHKVPFSLGGSDDDSNLWTLCDECNGGKSNNYVD